MALGGGTFLVQNKVLPGAYINFISVAQASATLSDRGIVTIPLAMNWGPEGKIFTVEQADFIKNSQKIFGYAYTADELKPMREIFLHAKTVHFFRLGSSGVKASNTYATAKYPGTRGNDLRVVITANENSTEQKPLFDVETFLGTVQVDLQEGVAAITDLKANAYDQLRYLKNKDTITEEGLKASDLLKRIATDFRLNLGTVEDTGYTLETIVEENQTLFDMIQSALDETLMNTKQLYVLYDDAGKLTLKNINTMKLNLLIDEETGENFSYESSIDEQTYNKIKLAYNDEKTGKRELFIAQDGAKMNQWGVLQYFEEVQTKTGASAKADALLKLYDQKTRKLTIQNAFGDVRVRAGSAVVVALNLGDIVTNNYMVVNKVTHTFRGDEHMMELDLIGGEFIA